MAKTVVVVGTQWGDEGKGKITDYLASSAEVVVRSQGGNNAGHSIFFGQKKHALHLLPSGVFNKNKINIMADGMVVNPKALIDEINLVKNEGFQDFKLYLSNRAHVVMPYHLELDGLFESIREDQPIGTTKKGIGPAYMDKASRFGIRVGDLMNKEKLIQKLQISLSLHNPLFQTFGKTEFSIEAIAEEYYAYGQTIKEYVTDTTVLLNQLLEEDRKILFEGAQGSMLCLDHGTYPFVTSSSPTAAAVPLNAGIMPQAIKDVVGVTKAYSTRVGSGSFPTEFEDEIAKGIRERGFEYGTTTGRPRRIGWIDGVVLKHAKRINGITGLAIMLLDVLTGVEEIKICYAYELDGEIIEHIPADYDCYSRVKPLYKTYPGWNEDLTNSKSYDELPQNCINYLKAIETITGSRITIISVGPDRKQTIVLHKYF
ncbi:MAG: adenylosuccinate synthase [Candidatus Izemoplasmatales bacterium]|nr:adenylosuccinate synthase [Candidatus Izemoplasmatales bacterium]